MYTSTNTLKISDLRMHTAAVIDEIENKSEPVVVFSRSKPKVVIINYSTFQSLKIVDKKNPGKFFANPPKRFLFKKKGIDSVKLIRSLRD